MTNWLQRLEEELQNYGDDDLQQWPVEWWMQLQREGMNPPQAIRYTTRVMHKKTTSRTIRFDAVRPTLTIIRHC
jgi:hypothetical protein